MRVLHLLLLVCWLFPPTVLSGQSFYSTEGHISFFSQAPLEDIKAEHNGVVTTFDTTNGEIEFSLSIEGFEFRKSLMRTHFNENYMECQKYPKANFSGRVTGWNTRHLDQQKEVEVEVIGKMTIHGVSQNIKALGTLTRDQGGFIAEAKFPLSVADFDIKVPKLLRRKIAEIVEVTVRAHYLPYVP